MKSTIKNLEDKFNTIVLTSLEMDLIAYSIEGLKNQLNHKQVHTSIFVDKLRSLLDELSDLNTKNHKEDERKENLIFKASNLKKQLSMKYSHISIELKELYK